jgi:hypothetical protein
MENVTRTCGGMILETRLEFGRAARKNRGSFKGQECHKLLCEYVVGIVEGEKPAAGTFGDKFIQTGKPVLRSCRPLCGCTQGQFAGTPVAGKTAENVTCKKCL